MARSRIRKRHIVLAIFGVLALLLGRFVYVGMTAQPGSDLPRIAQVRALVAAAQGATEADFDSDRNGWPELAAALEAMGEINTRHLNMHGDWRAPEDAEFTTPVEFDAIGRDGAHPDIIEFTLAAMREQEEAGILDRIDAALTKAFFLRPLAPNPGDDPEDGPAMYSILLPELGRVRALARADSARFRLAVDTGDHAAVERIIHRQIGLARAASLQATMIDRLVGIAVAGLIDRNLRSATLRGQLPPETLRGLADALGERLLTLPRALPMKTEHLVVLGAVDWCHTDNGRGDGRLMLTRLRKVSWMAGGGGPVDGAVSALGGAKIANLAGFLFPSKKDTVAVVDEMFDGCVKLMTTPPYQRGPELFDPDAFITSLPRGYMLLQMIMPALGSFVYTHDMFYTEVAGTRALLLVEAIRLETGAPPATLEALGDAAIDPMTGKPFGYILAPGGGSGGRGYILYAFGADLTDNQADPAPIMDSLRRGRGTGLDWVISEPEVE